MLYTTRLLIRKIMKSVRKILMEIVGIDSSKSKEEKTPKKPTTLYEKYPMWDSKQSYLYV